MSSDFWNEVREQVAAEFGQHVYVLTQCAAAGDLSPRILHYNHAQSRRFRLKYGVEADPFQFGARTPESYNKIMCERRDIAERIVGGIKEVFDWAKHDILTTPAVRHLYRPVQLARRMVSEAERSWCEETIRTMEANLPDEANGTPEEIRKAVSRFNAIKGRNQRALDRCEKQKSNQRYDTAIHAVQIGEIGFVTNQFELFMDFQHRIQARSPFVQTFIVQLAGCENGSYLATERGAANKGYSASLFCNQVSARGGQELVEASLEMLDELSRNTHGCGYERSTP